SGLIFVLLSRGDYKHKFPPLRRSCPPALVLRWLSIRESPLRRQLAPRMNWPQRDGRLFEARVAPVPISDSQNHCFPARSAADERSFGDERQVARGHSTRRFPARSGRKRS